MATESNALRQGCWSILIEISLKPKRRNEKKVNGVRADLEEHGLELGLVGGALGGHPLFQSAGVAKLILDDHVSVLGPG